MEGQEFLRYIWGEQQCPDASYWLAVRTNDGSFVEFEADAELSSVKNWEIANDAPAFYFCPNPFDGRRQKENFVESRWLYQDLDAVPPDACPIFPDVWWETSQGRYQGMWLLDNSLEQDQFWILNKALNRACHADPGTWNLTRYLRVPGSWSGKRETRVSRAHVSSSLLVVA